MVCKVIIVPFPDHNSYYFALIIASDYNCNGCCNSDSQCMQIIGYKCINKACICDFSTMNTNKNSLTTYNNSSDSLYCGTCLMKFKFNSLFVYKNF